MKWLLQADAHSTFYFDGGLSTRQNLMSKYAVHTFRTCIFELWNCSNETFPWCDALAHTNDSTKTHNSPFQIYFCPCIEFVCKFYLYAMQHNPGIYMFNFKKKNAQIISEVQRNQGTTFYGEHMKRISLLPLKAPFKIHKQGNIMRFDEK